MAGEVHNYQCTLSDSLLEKAVKELNEDPNTRRQEIQTLRERLRNYSGLKARVDDAFLIRFLRARKFDQERTFTLIMHYYQMKKDNEDIYADMTPRGVKHMLEAGVSRILPTRGKEGEAILHLNIGRWDPDKYPMIDVFRVNFVVLSKAIESEETQVNGIRIINDMSELGWAHAKSISPTMAKKITTMLQDAFPMRLKGIHYVHEPTFFDYVFAIIRPFLKEKLQKRLNFHGENVEELHKFMPPESLPEEYKGSLPPFNREEYVKSLLACEAEYEENAKYGLVSMTMQKDSKTSQDATQSLAGTFKKLNVD